MMPRNRRRTGKCHAWRVSLFIIGVVMSNNLAEYAILGGLTTFLSGISLKKSLVTAVATVNMTEGLTSFMAIIGSIIADAYVSRYFVVLVSVALYIYGLFLFTISVPYGKPLLYPALVLIAMGNGGQQHTLLKFGADQFNEHIKDKSEEHIKDESKAKAKSEEHMKDKSKAKSGEHVKEKSKAKFKFKTKFKAKFHTIAWWNMGCCLGGGVGLVLALLPHDNPGCIFWKICWNSDVGEKDFEKATWTSLGLFSTLFMLLAFLVLVSGTLYYHRVGPNGSPFTHMLRVVVAAARKRRLKWPADDSRIHGRWKLDGVSSTGTSGTINTSDGLKDYEINGSKRHNHTSDEHQLQQRTSSMKEKHRPGDKHDHANDSHDMTHNRRDNYLYSKGHVHQRVSSIKDKCGLGDTRNADGGPDMTHNRRDNHTNGKGHWHRLISSLKRTRRLGDDKSPTGDDGARLLLPQKNSSVDLENGNKTLNYAHDERLEQDLDHNNRTGEDNAVDVHIGLADQEDDADDGAPLDDNDHTGEDDADDDPPLSLPHKNYIYDLEDEYPATNGTHWLDRTNGLRCLDKAAIIEKREANEESKWRLCTQTEVEETKLFLRMLPVWTTFLMYGIVLSMGYTFFMEQASTLDGSIGGFEIPITVLLAFSSISKVAVTEACNWLNKVLEHGIPPKVRIGAGLFLSALCCLTASLLEKKRLNVVVRNQSSMKIFWLIPQFCILGAMKGLVGDGIEELFVSQVPKMMFACRPAFIENVEGMGSICSAILMILTDQLNQVGGHRRWFAHEINESRLDWYFAMLAGLSLINLFLYTIVRKGSLWRGTRNTREN